MHQVAVLHRQRPGRAWLRQGDRLLWAWLYRIWPRCLKVLVQVQTCNRDPVPCQDLIRDQFIGPFERSRLPAVMATPQAGEASQEMMAKMNASMAAILRLAEMNR